MASTTITSNYQIQIPKAVLEAFRLKPGQKMEMLIFQGHITLVPVGQMKEIRGIAPGIDTRVPRDADRV